MAKKYCFRDRRDVSEGRELMQCFYEGQSLNPQNLYTARKAQSMNLRGRWRQKKPLRFTGRAPNVVNVRANREPVSDKVEGMDQHPKLAPDFHLHSVACVHAYPYL